MNRLRLVFVGEPKASWAKEASRHYLEALSRHVRCDQTLIKDARDKDPEAKRRKESQAILAALGPKDLVVGLDERGKAPGSKGLAALLGTWLEDPGRAPCFVVGGPYGYTQEARSRFDQTLSLGPYTLPHELARAVLLEQLYRALTILAGHPYHHQ